MGWFNRHFPDKKIRRRIFILIIILIIALFFFWPRVSEQVMVKAGFCLFKAEIAASPEEHYQGLSNRIDLCRDCSMLFLFPQKEPKTFVMRNMNFPLDIIFIADQKIVNIYEQLPPEGARPENFYRSGQAVNAVLEINAGQAAACNLQVGDIVTWSR